MVFVWGSKTVLRFRGNGADFCFSCRDLRQFREQGALFTKHIASRDLLNERFWDSAEAANPVKPK